RALPQLARGFRKLRGYPVRAGRYRHRGPRVRCRMRRLGTKRDRYGRHLFCACTVALFGCGPEVTMPPAPAPSACAEIEDGALLSSREFADLVTCHYPASDGWQLLVLRGAPIHPSPPSVGRARGWDAVLVHDVAGEAL